MIEFFNVNLDLIIITLTIIVVLGIGFFLFPYLKRNNLLNKKNIDNAHDIINLIMLVLRELNKNPNSKKSDIELIDSIVDIVFNYIEQNFKNISNEEKLKLANNFTIEILEKLNIELTAQRKILIDTGFNILYKITTQ